MKATAGSTKTCDSDCAGSTSAASSGPGPSIRRITSTKVPAVARSMGWLSAATASGSHNSSTSRSACPHRRSHSRTVNASASRWWRGSRARARPTTVRRSAHDKAGHASTPAASWNGEGSAGQRSSEAVPAPSIMGTASDDCTSSRSRAPMRAR